MSTETAQALLKAMIHGHMPAFVKACEDPEADQILIHQDSFSTTETQLLGAAIKYAGLMGKHVQMVAHVPAGPPLFYIQNGPAVVGNCARWWKAGGHGYTCDLKEAWRVPGEEAARICKSRPEEDRPQLASAVDRISQTHVDVQTLRLMDRHCIKCGAVLIAAAECPHCGTAIQDQPR